MKHDPLALWLRAAARYPLLPKSETLRLAKKVRAWQDWGKDPVGGKKALDKLVKCNLRLVPSVWRQYAGHIRANEESALDILQQGAIGIQTAALKFDPTRGYEFSTVAYLWIRKEVQDWMRRYERTIRVSSDCQSIGGQAPHYRANFENEHGRPPTDAEMAHRFKITEKTLAFYLERWKVTRTASLNMRIAGGRDQRESDEPELIDTIVGGDTNEVEDNDRLHEMQRLSQLIATQCDLDEQEVFEAMEWRGKQPEEIRQMRIRIRTVGRRIYRTQKGVRDLLKD
jgi:RNA polymerase sigma factor (sigma-70 family)